MSFSDDHLLDGSDPDWDPDDVVHGLCEMCGTPNEHADRDYCPVCEPRQAEEDIRVLASYDIDQSTGTVTRCTP